jgi:hypothetical protein
LAASFSVEVKGRFVQTLRVKYKTVNPATFPFYKKYVLNIGNIALQQLIPEEGHMQTLYGSHWLLAKMPLVFSGFFVTAIALALVWYGRVLFEGKGYNVSFASWGDVLLVGIILIGGHILQRKQELPEWAVAWWVHALALLAALVVCYFWNKVPAPMFVDKFHNVVIGPMFIYFLLSIAPVIWCGDRGWEWRMALGCLGVWACLFVYDAVVGRLPQQEFLYKNHGTRLAAWEGKFGFLPPK